RLIVDTDMVLPYVVDTTVTQVFVLEHLPANDTYRWRIIAADALGNSAAFGDSYFLLDTAPPSRPVLVKPVAGIETYGQVVFDWNASSDSLSGIYRYRIQVDTLGTFTGVKAADSYMILPDTAMTLRIDTYFWRVIAEDSAGNTETSVTDTFRNRIVPDTPVLDAIAFSTNTRFYDSVPIDTGVAGDTVWFAADSMHIAMTVAFSATIRDSMEVGPIFDSGAQTDASNPYQAFFAIRAAHASTDTWTTVTVRSTQYIADTLILRFRPDTIPPDSVTLISPRGESVPVTPAFSWTASCDSQSGISSYRLEVSGTSDFSAIVDWATTSHPDTDVSLFFPLADSTYYWRVLAYDSVGNKMMSGLHVETFLVQQGFDTANPNIWYVNDASLAGDTYTLAVGSSANNGLTRTSPKRYLNDLEGKLTAGDTVYVDVGSYAEPDTFDIDTQCWIIGADSQTTLLNFGDSTTNSKGVKLNAAGISISNFGIKDAFFAVFINHVDSCIVSRIEGRNSNAGILMTDFCEGNRVENCYFHHNGWVGIYVAAASQNTLYGNHVHDHANQGILLDWSSDRNRLTGNNSHWNTLANIEITGGSDSNWCDSNITYGGGQEGFKVANSDSNICEYNTSNGNTWGAFAVGGTAKQNIFYANRVPQNNDQGFYIAGGAGNVFDSNILEQIGTDGFYVLSDSTTLRRNSVNIAANEGFDLDGPNYCFLDSNVVIKATNYGFFLRNNADSNTLRYSQVDSTTATDAIKIESSAYNYIYKCLSTASASGAFSLVTNAHHNTISTCTSTRDVIGIWASGGGNNTYDNIRMYFPTWRALSVSGNGDSFLSCLITGGSNNGFYLDGPGGAANNLLRQNQIQYMAWAGIEVVGSGGNRLESNTVYGGSADGILLRDTSGSNSLIGNRSIRNTNGFRLDTYCTNNRVVQNLAETNTQHGFRILNGSDSCLLVSNTARGNSYSGFTFRNSNRCTFLANTCDSNGTHGVSVESSVASIWIEKNNILLGGSYGANAEIVALNFSRTWWGTTDSVQIRNRITGQQANRAVYQPFRLGIIDSALTADTTAPNPPDTVAAAAMTESTIEISWSAASGSEEPEAAAGLNGYRVYSSRTRDTSYWALLAQVAAGVDRLTDSNLAIGDTRYYRVSSMDAAPFVNESDYSDSQPGARTTHETVPPSAFTLSLPVHGTETKNVVLVFRWTPATDSSNPVTYRLIIDTDMAGTYVLDTTVIDSAVVARLRAGDTYFWRVIAADSYGTARQVGDSRVLIDTAPPTAPGLLLPAGGAETSQTSIAFTWTASTDVLTRVTNYQLQAATDALFASIAADSANGVATTGTLSLPGSRTYYWRVIAYDAAGNSETSASTTILVDTAAPVPGAMTSPSDGYETKSASIRFLWSSAWDSHAGVAGYRLQVDTEGNFTDLVSDSATGTETSGWLTLPANDTYRWRVLVMDDAGNTAALAPRLLVIDTLPPVAGLLSLPADGSETNVTTVFFSWIAGYDSHSGLSAYRLQVDTDADFAGLIVDSSTGPATTGSRTLPANDTYQWRILLVDDAGNTSAVAPRVIVVDTAPPAIPLLFAPAELAETSSVSVWFDWIASADSLSGVNRYRIQVDSAGTFSGTLAADTIIIGATETGLALAEGVWYWRVTAIDDAENISATDTARRVLVDRTLPLFLSLGITSTPFLYFSEAGGIDTGVREDTIYFNANGGGSGQIDTVLVTASGADHAVFPTIFNGINTTDTVLPFLTAFTIAGGTADTTMSVQIGDTAGNLDTYLLHWIRDFTAPPAVALTSPANGQVQGDSTPTLSWLASVDTQAVTRGYVVQVSANAPFTSLLEDSFEYALTHNIMALPDSTYFWRVIPYDSCGMVDTASATVWSFTVDSRIPRISAITIVSSAPLFFFDDTPVTPGAVADTVWYNPTGAGAGQIDTITLHLEDDNESQAIGSAAYTAVQLTDSGFNRDSYNLIYQIPLDSPSQSLTFSVFDILGFQDTSYVRFEMDTAGPTAAIPTTPAAWHETSSITFSLTWSASVDTGAGLREYRLQIDTDAVWSGVVLESSTALSTSGTVTLPANDTYVWRILSIDRVSNSTPGDSRYFIIDTAPPLLTSPIAPIDGTGTNAVSIAFSWSASSDSLAGISLYRIQIDTDGNFIDMVTDSATGLSTSATLTLLPNDTYRWRVIAVDGAGNWTASAPFRLVIDTAPPSTFALQLPLHAIETTSVTTTFRWSAASDSNLPVSYRLIIDTDLAVGYVVDTTVFDLEEICSLPANDTYLWRVLAMDTIGNIRTIGDSRLVIDTASPTQSAIISPKNGETHLVGSVVTLDWNASSDSISGFRRYRIQVDTTGSFAGTLAMDTYQATADTTVAFARDSYFWRIIAEDDLGNSSISSTETFFVVLSPDTTLPDSFNLLLPAGATETAAAGFWFRWTASADSTLPLSYRLIVDTDMAGGFVIDTTVSDTEEYVRVPANDTYLWRVIATDLASNSRIVGDSSFTVDTLPPTFPTILSPLTGETRTVGPVSLDWNASGDSISGFRRYRIQIDTTGSFTGTLAVDSYQAVPDTTVTLAIEHYYWHVVAEDDLGNTSSSSTETFRVETTLDTTAPLSFTMLSPVAGHETAAKAFWFRWSASADSNPGITYRLIVDTDMAGSFIVDTTVADTEEYLDLYANDTFLWRVLAIDTSLNSRAAGDSTFAIDTRPPTLATLAGPLTNETRTVGPVTFDWNASSDSLSGFRRYRIQVDLTGTFAGALLIDSYQSSPDSTFTLAIDTYHWRVIAEDELGNAAATSAETFRVVTTIDTTAPLPFTLLEPVNGMETTATAFWFRWSTSTDSNPGITYRLIVDTDMAGSFIVDTTVADSEEYVRVPTNDTFYWRVLAIDTSLNSQTAGDSSFAVDSRGPTISTLVAPINSETRTAGTPVTLDWNAASDSIAGVFRYRIQVDTTGLFTGTLAVDSYQAAPDTVVTFAGDTYFWRIIAIDDLANTTASTVDSFRVLASPDTTAPAAFTLLYPASLTETTATATWFRWTISSDSSLPITYRLILDAAIGGNSFVDTTVADTEEYILLPANDTYLWRVIASDAFGNSRNVGDSSIAVDTTSPLIPTLVDPTAEETRALGTPFTLDWNASSDSIAGFFRYRLQIDTSGSFAGPLVIDSFQPSADTTLLLVAATYFWRVTAFDDLGLASVSVPESFRVVAPAETIPPTAFTLLTPANPTETAAASFWFRWSAALDSSPPVSYRLIIDTDMAGAFVVDTTVSDTEEYVRVPANDT
ncbi:MAG: right-handed parallel beta-helix repeat-containing protein, partial [Candidatus Hydrogenedentota bacterium]